ncbi:MAG: hypothetical protein ACPG8W_12670 [Candidatus Promineifilaceae bacterium]
MAQRKQSLWQRLFSGFMTAFMLIGSVATIGAMRVNPPANLDQIVLGNIDEDLVELAVETNNEALITEAIVEPSANFFAITSDEDGGEQTIANISRGQTNDEDNPFIDWFDDD